jgi:hypothetical protein
MTSPANDDDYIEETSYVIMDLTAYRSEEAIRSLAHETNGLAISVTSHLFPLFPLVESDSYFFETNRT